MSWFGRINNPSPCGKDCKERKEGCAINCERWAAYKAEKMAEYEKNAERARNDRYTPAKDRNIRFKLNENKFGINI